MFCAADEPILASVKCSMVQCKESGCVLKLFTKSFEFKKSTTSRNRGSVKGTNSGRSVELGTCMQQRFSLRITEDLMRQAKEGKTTPLTPVPQTSPEKERRSVIKKRMTVSYT